MIFFVVPIDEMWTIEAYLQQYGTHLQNLVALVTYDDIALGKALPAGTYVFSAIDRLFPQEREIATRFCCNLLAAGSRVINHPGRVVRRYDLLKDFYRRERNLFNVFRAHEFHRCKKFPVFIRPEGDHSGSLTGLLYSRLQVQRKLARAALDGYRLRDMIIVEYCDTADPSGIFRMYCATIVGDEIIPQIVVHNRNWITKWGGRLVNEITARESQDYVETNPHARWLKETFEIARTKYGRVDYGLLNGVPQLWEINTNPTIARPVGVKSGLTEAQEKLVTPVRNNFLQRFGVALERLDGSVGASQTIRIELSGSERRQWEKERTLKARIRARRTVTSKIRPVFDWVRQ